MEDNFIVSAKESTSLGPVEVNEINQVAFLEEKENNMWRGDAFIISAKKRPSTELERCNHL